MTLLQYEIPIQPGLFCCQYLWLISQVYDEDNLQQDKRLGVAKLVVNTLEPEITQEVTLKLLHSLDPIKNRDTKDRGTLHLKVSVGFYLLLRL